MIAAASDNREFVVTCADGVIRHGAPFGSRYDARTWAEWGHCCLREHRIEQSAA